MHQKNENVNSMKKIFSIAPVLLLIAVFASCIEEESAMTEINESVQDCSL